MNKDLTGLTRDYVSRPKSQYFSEIVRWGEVFCREKNTHPANADWGVRGLDY